MSQKKSPVSYFGGRVIRLKKVFMPHGTYYPTWRFALKRWTGIIDVTYLSTIISPFFPLEKEF